MWLVLLQRVQRRNPLSKKEQLEQLEQVALVRGQGPAAQLAQAALQVSQHCLIPLVSHKSLPA